MRYKQPREYLRRMQAGSAVQSNKEVPAREVPFEFMMNAMRLAAGVESSLFQERTGLPLAVIASQLEKARDAGLIESGVGRLRPSPKGRRFLNDLLTLFLDEPG